MKSLSLRLGALLVSVNVATFSFAQFPIPWDGGGGNSNWTTAANWNHPSGGLPTGAFDETAVIDNGDTVVVNSNLALISPPDGPPGELEVSNGSTLQVIGSGAFVMDDNNGPSVDGSARFTSGGTLSLSGSAASFAASSLSFANGGIYNPVFTSGTQGLISVPGAIEFGGGTLRPTVSFTPAGPQSWILADAAAINGEFVLDTSAAGLAPGSKLTTSIAEGGVNGQQLRLNLSQVLSLSINADTGAASISSPTGAAITITGYSVSAVGQLDPAGWTTLTTQLGGGWGVAGTPTKSRLDELAGPIPPANTAQASLTVNSTPRPIGSPFDEQLKFREQANVKFEYVTNTGEIVEGTVQYTGLNAVNDLLLTVDPATGQGRLQNSSLSTIKLKGYSILSESGALKPAAGSWNSLDDQNVTGVDEANATANNLSELIPMAANDLTLTPGQSYQLGNMFTTSGAHDLELEFLMVDNRLDGDFNDDGSVNAADYTVWRDGLGGEFTAADYQVWKDNFGATGAGDGVAILSGTVKYGSLSGGLGAVSAVPEPMSLSLLGVSVVVLSACRRQQRA